MGGCGSVVVVGGRNDCSVTTWIPDHGNVMTAWYCFATAFVSLNLSSSKFIERLWVNLGALVPLWESVPDCNHEPS